MRSIDYLSLIEPSFRNGLFLNPNLRPCRYRLFCGARNTGKSYNIIGLEMVLKILIDPRRNVLVVRQNYADIRDTCFSQILQIISALGLDDEFESYTSPFMIRRKSTGQMIRFKGFNNPSSIASQAFVTGYLTDVYVEEAFEVASYEDFMILDGSARLPKDAPKDLSVQITLCMNTWSKDHWIYERMYKGRIEEDEDAFEAHPYIEAYDPYFTLGFGFGLYIHDSTFRANSHRVPEWDMAAEMMRKQAPSLYRSHFLGMWGETGDLVYEEWARNKDRLTISPEEAARTNYRNFVIGIDTGLSNGEGKRRNSGDIRSATVMTLVGLTADCSKLIAIDEWYFTNQGRKIPRTQTDILNDMVNTLIYWIRQKYATNPTLLKREIPVFVDSASEGFRWDFHLQCEKVGLHNVRAALSTKQPIVSRIDFTRVMQGWGDLLISTDCKNLMREMSSLHTDPKTGIRENTNDHAVNSFEYAMVPLQGNLLRWKQFGGMAKKGDLYANGNAFRI